MGCGQVSGRGLSLLAHRRMLCKSFLKAEERQLQRWRLALLSRVVSLSRGTRGTFKLALS